MSFHTLFDIPFGALAIYVSHCERWQNGGWQRITAPPSLINYQIKKKEKWREQFQYFKVLRSCLVAHATGNAERCCYGGQDGNYHLNYEFPSFAFHGVLILVISNYVRCTDRWIPLSGFLWSPLPSL